MAHTHLSGLGLVLILVFGCLLLALIAELYYLLWWKKQLISNNNNTIEEDYSNHTKEMFYLFCWDKPNNSIITHQNSTSNTPNPVHNTNEPDLEMGLGSGKDLVFKALGEESVEAELMRLHNLMGPPRFLFTIKEESKEDLESDDGKSKCGDRSRKGSRTRSLGDLIVAVDDSGRDNSSFDGIRCINDGMIAPSNSNSNNSCDSSDGIRCISAGMIAPSNSNSMRFSPMKGTIPNDLGHYYSNSCNYSNPLFESSMEAELFRLRASPPPKFKFLRDAEEKLYRRLLEEAQKSGILQEQEGILDNSVLHPCCTTTIDEEKDVSLMSSCSSQEGILDNSQSIPCSNTIQQYYTSVSMAPANCEIRESRMSSCSSQEGILDNSQSIPCSNTIQQYYSSVSMAPANCEVRESRMSSCSSQVLPLVSSPPDHALLSTSIQKNPSLH